MSDSILQVNLIKNKGGTATGITVDNSNANISIGTTLAVNTINEVTSANGVTIDGLSLKDGNVVPAAGKGIDFSAASGSASGSSSALLDDYEEGTWTPTLLENASTTNKISQVTVTRAKYVKIGKLVELELLLRQFTGSFSGNIVIGGIPFTSETTHWCTCGTGSTYNGHYTCTAMIDNYQADTINLAYGTGHNYVSYSDIGTASSSTFTLNVTYQTS